MVKINIKMMKLRMMSEQFYGSDEDNDGEDDDDDEYCSTDE